MYCAWFCIFKDKADIFNIFRIDIFKIDIFKIDIFKIHIFKIHIFKIHIFKIHIGIQNRHTRIQIKNSELTFCDLPIRNSHILYIIKLTHIQDSVSRITLFTFFTYQDSHFQDLFFQRFTCYQDHQDSLINIFENHIFRIHIFGLVCSVGEAPASDPL